MTPHEPIMPDETQITKARTPILGWIAAGGLVALAVLRAVVVFTPQLWWATGARALPYDPELGLIVTEYGPAGAAITDMLMFLVLALALADAAWRGRRVYTGLLALWAVGVGFALWHGMHDAESLRLAGAWSGATALALAALHLAPDPSLRRVVIAAAIALAIPLAMQTGLQVLVEHPNTVRMYEETREQFAQSRGWALDSTQLRQYEERLYQNEATARFGFSNVFGSFTMTLALLAVGVAAAGLRKDLKAPAGYVAAAIAIVAGALLALTFSKGAMLATAAAVGGTAVACIATRWLPRPELWWRLAAVGIVAAGILGVTARGFVGEPDTAAGERSLLFRYHYWQASARMVADHPIAGVGPGRFQQAQMTRKNPLSPEDPADPHNIFASWIATLGLGGWAWSALLVAMLWKAGGVTRRTDPPLDSIEPTGVNEQTRWAFVIATGLLALVAGFIAERLRHDPISALSWLAGAAGFIAVAGYLAGHRPIDLFYARLGLFAAVTALLLHAQIEMSLTKAMSAPLLLSVVGLAAGIGCAKRGEPAPARCRPLGFASAGVVAAGAIVVLVMLVVPTVERESALHDAAEVMAIKPRDMRSAVNQSNTTISHLRRAQQAMPQDAQLGFHESQVLVEAAFLFNRANDPAARDRLLDQAMTAVARSRLTGSRLAASWMHETNIAQAAFDLTSNPRWLARAADAAAQRTIVDPNGLDSHVRAGDLAHQRGDHERAAEFYRRALKINDRLYLDPKRQLTDEQRARVESRSEPG